MKKLLTLLTATAAFNLLPSVSQATCVATGTIPRIFVQVGLPTNIGVRGNGLAPTFFNFTTTNAAVIDAALVAEANHITVTITGNASSCSAPSGGLSSGGSVINVLVSP